MAKVKILLVEDDPFLLNMYAAKFEMENFKVNVADDGEKGMQMIEKEIPDIVLLDIMLPKMTGFEVLEKIRNNPKTSKLPVILLTNLSQKDEIDKAMSLGVSDYLIKAHFMPSEVVEKIKNVLGLQ